jgi:hypothetical protein
MPGLEATAPRPEPGPPEIPAARRAGSRATGNAASGLIDVVVFVDGMRERVFGGVTRTVLTEAALPVLMCR